MIIGSQQQKSWNFSLKKLTGHSLEGIKNCGRAAIFGSLVALDRFLRARRVVFSFSRKLAVSPEEYAKIQRIALKKRGLWS